MEDRLDNVLDLHRRGWNVLAAPDRGKTPLGPWKRWQSERVAERDVRDWFAGRAHNVFIVCGRVSRLVVLDCDDREALDWWHGQLGPILAETARVQTSQGFHFYFSIGPDEVVPNASSAGYPGTGRWDLRGEGGGVIAPPSVHESGHRYEWVADRGPDAMRELPPEATGALSSASNGAGGGEAGGAVRSQLTWLLQNAPDGEGGRNQWLTRIAGHYAKTWEWLDAYEQHVVAAAQLIRPPLPDYEVRKTMNSVWKAEQDQRQRRAQQPTEDTGWLCSGGSCVMAQVREKGEDGFEIGLGRWMDADVRVSGVTQVGERRIYEVDLVGERISVRGQLLEASTVADPKKLNAWLAQRGASVGPPDTLWPRSIPATARLLRYLESQEGQRLEGTDCLGWNEKARAFVTLEGAIRADSVLTHADIGIRPVVEPTWAPYRYGFGPEADCRETIREILTFHDEEVCAVFGAWWAACLLKPQIMKKSSQFPFMALEATSESGKTTGFFSLLLQLAGNTEPQNVTTRAALRDYLSAHRNGIVWLDDLDELDYIGELLRASTVEGGVTKKAGDNKAQAAVHMRAALVISGESLGLDDQKALIDRAVRLEVGSPVERRSIRDPHRAQWSDVETLKAKWPDLSLLSGTAVQLALRQAGMVDSLGDLREGATGRHADKMAIVRLGARVLWSMLGEHAVDSWVLDYTDRWTARQKGPGAENSLTLKLVPGALARFNWPVKPEGADRHPGGVSATPAFVEGLGSEQDALDPVVWFSPAAVAEWWSKESRSRGARFSDRTESEGALAQQARALGLGGAAGSGRKLFRLVGGGRRMYWKVDGQLAADIIARSREEE